MEKERMQVARAILYLIILLGIIPTALIASNFVFSTDHSPDEYSPLTYFQHPATPAVFALLFILGSGLAVYLSKKLYVVLLLPLLYLAIVPLMPTQTKQDQPNGPFTFYGQTEPGKGFKSYSKDRGLRIEVEFPEAVKQKIIASGKRPIILTTLSGEWSWTVTGTNALYPLRKNKVKQDWSSGFVLYLRSTDHKHSFGHGTTTKQTHSKIISWPKKHGWFISYAVILSEE